MPRKKEKVEGDFIVQDGHEGFEMVEGIEVDSRDAEELNEKLDLGLKQFGGIGPKGLENLEHSGIRNVYDLHIHGSQTVAECASLTALQLDKAMNDSWAIIQKNGRTRKDETDPSKQLKQKKELKRIKTGVPGFDEAIGGGFEPEMLIEVYGENGAGKSQLCFTVMVEEIQQHGGEVLFIDCENTFEPERIVEIALARGYASTEDEAIEKFLTKVRKHFVPNTDRLIYEMSLISQKMIDNPNIKLIIVDGSIGQFRKEYVGRGTLSVRQNNLAKFMALMSRIAYFFDCTVLFTNQVQADPSLMFGDPIKPIGGNIVGHESRMRIYLKKAKNRVARIVKSSKRAVEDIPFALDEKGFVKA